MYDLILKNISRHVSLTPSEVELFKSRLKHRKLRKRYLLVQAGEVARAEHFVIKGCFRAFATDRDGNDHVIMFAIEDWWVSDFESLTTGRPATLSIEALEDSEVIYIEKPDLDSLMEEIPVLNKFFRIILQNAFIAQQQRILSTISNTAEERYAMFIGKYAQFEQRIPQHHIASYLGTTPETLSRIRRLWMENNS